MNFLFHSILFLAVLCTVAATAISGRSWGPEGPVGVWLLFALPCLLAAVLLIALVQKEWLGQLPGGPAVQYASVLGVVVAMGAAFFGSLDRSQTLTSWVLRSVPYFILTGCAAALYLRNLPEWKIGRWILSVLLGIPAIAGWGLLSFGLFLAIRNTLAESEQQINAEAVREKQFEEEEVVEFHQLGKDPPLSMVLRFAWSRNAEIRSQTQAMLKSHDHLVDELIELLSRDNENAVRYVAFICDIPAAELAPAWAAMLERQRKAWDFLQHDENAGKWEPNLSMYFEGARKLRRVNGDLAPALRSWYELLKKSRGLGNLADFVKTLL